MSKEIRLIEEAAAEANKPPENPTPLPTEQEEKASGKGKKGGAKVRDREWVWSVINWLYSRVLLVARKVKLHPQRPKGRELSWSLKEPRLQHQVQCTCTCTCTCLFLQFLAFKNIIKNTCTVHVHCGNKDSQLH